MSAIDALDDSSSDDDFYQNLTKTMKRKVTNGFGINDDATGDDSFSKYTDAIISEPVQKRSKEVVIDEDTDDDEVSYESQNIQQILEAKSKIYEANARAKAIAEKVSKNPIQTSIAGRTRAARRLTPTHKEIEIASQLQLLESLDAQVKACTHTCKVDTSNRYITEVPVVEEEDDCVHFLIKNLETPSEASDYRSWKMNDPISLLRREYSVKWGCNIKEVVITCKNLPLQDSDTPVSLKMPNEVQLINVFRVGLEKKKDPNKITVKCLQADKRPVEIEFSKSSKFSSIKTLIQEKLKLAVITKLVFDSAQVHDDETPEELDMENDDCLEVYA
ncbi:unnamed protein product [Auanema sp. JU1783]|nr:unnamed protein product [Auanema sp. JU1783]